MADSQEPFAYDSTGPMGVRDVGQRVEAGVESRLFTFLTPQGDRRAATLHRPLVGGPHATILYVHWYEPEAASSNRTQFEEEAVAMAQRGTVCLLVETMWSERDWFIKRTQADDPDNTRNQVIELRRAADLLLMQPEVNPQRFAYVGHDFGAMHGVVLGAVDPRPTHYVLMAGTPRFSDWYLYYPAVEGEARTAHIQEMEPLDPLTHIAALAPAPVLFQFATDDPHVPRERAERFFAAAGEPKELRWYDAGHGLTAQATEERMAWLSEQLGLKDT